MTPDKAHKDTDGELDALERRVRSVYGEAQKDVQQKLDTFTGKFEAKDKLYRAQLEAGKITQRQYRAWQQGQVFQGKQWKAKLDSITDTLNRSNIVAQRIINSQLNGVFAHNANWQSYSLEHGAGINFGFELYDADTVARLLRDEPELLPKSRVNIPKDKKWNQKIITQQIAQGIIQGEDIRSIGKRMEVVTDRNRNLSLTRARTAMTGAENAGRVESLTRAQGMGIKVKKEWVSTLDMHTRTSHRHLDGQTADVNGYFHGELGKIRFPGDPQGPAGEVYNCRCTLVGALEDYPDEYNAQRYDNIDGVKVADMSYSDWEKAKKAGQQIPSRREKPVVTERRTRRPGYFDRGRKPVKSIPEGQNPSIKFDDKLMTERWKESVQITEQLASEFNTKLKSVHVGSEHSGGSVQVSGSEMFLSSKKPEVAFHEFAHTLSIERQTKFGLYDEGDFWKEIHKVQREYKKAVADDSTRWISSYEHSSNGADEFMAEAFTLALMKEKGFAHPAGYGKDLTYANKVLAIIRRWYGK